MTEKQLKEKSVFKYNMSFYYQSTIVYFVVFAVYLIIRGEFVDNSYLLLTEDPVIYFFALIVVMSMISLLYNLIKNRHLEIGEEEIRFIDRFKTKVFAINDIMQIKLTRNRNPISAKALRLIFIKIKNRRRRLVVRPYDYENENELIKRFVELKQKLESNNVR